MIIGIPRERKVHEYRVAAVPKTVRVMVERGHSVLVEKGAGEGSLIRDEEYVGAGARIVHTEEEIFSQSELIVKVKEPQKEEYPLLRPEHILFSYLHLAPSPELQAALIESGATAIAFETVELGDGSLPLLTPMSAIAGRLSVQNGVYYLQKPQGGKGVMIGGASGVGSGKVTVIGGGTVGYNAVVTALGLMAEVILIDIDQGKLRAYYENFGGRVKTLASYPEIVAEAVAGSDLVVGAVLVTGALAPRVITADMLSGMESGSVFVDIAIDQGGCSETSRPTTLDDPVYVERDVIHYCVTNVPSLVSRTATLALSTAVLPYVLKIAEGRGGIDDAPELKRGINVRDGKMTLPL